MKIKTSELTGAALDWAVAKCEEIPLLRVLRGHVAAPRLDDPMWCDYLEYSTDWAQGGPIIDKERLTVAAEGDPRNPVWVSSLGYPVKVTWTTGEAMRFCSMRGPNPLIAAMRCYVASKLGDEVDVPEELTC